MRNMLAERVVRVGISVVVAGLVASTAGTASAQTGPVAAYGFEEASGSGFVDSSGLGNNGTIGNATRAVGRFGNGLQFNGVSTWATVPDSASLDLTTAMT